MQTSATTGGIGVILDRRSWPRQGNWDLWHAVRSPEALDIEEIEPLAHLSSSERGGT
jgi:hypothetical protein